MASDVQLEGDEALGWVLGCSRPGAAHLRAGRPCQDACDLRAAPAADPPYLAVAVADGHGDRRHDRSERGAALAVRAALDEMFALARHGTVPEEWAQVKRMFKGDFAPRVLRRWHELVRGHAAEQISAPDEDPCLFSRYGTTLLTALAVRGTLLLSQLGDGAVFVIWPDGTIETPFPPETGGVGGETWSLSSAEAPRLWQTAVLGCAKEALVVLATDGLVNAFVNEEQLHRFAHSLADRVRDYNLSQVGAVLPTWLDSYSACASGDDITLALAQVLSESGGVRRLLPTL